jgi:hypothetical protein
MEVGKDRALVTALPPQSNLQRQGRFVPARGLYLGLFLAAGAIAATVGYSRPATNILAVMVEPTESLRGHLTVNQTSRNGPGEFKTAIGWTPVNAAPGTSSNLRRVAAMSPLNDREAASDAASLEANITSQPDSWFRRSTAAGAFLGYYFQSVRARRTHCARVGVDISAFTAAYERQYRDEHAQALEIMRHFGLDEEKLWTMLKESAESGEDEMFSKLRSVYSKGGDAGLCRVFIQSPEKTAAGINFAMNYPATYRVLMAQLPPR